MGKLTVFTTITPLPTSVPRQLALDMLHSHTEVIKLNPLVTGVKSIEAPRDASSDEYFSQWYEITEIISVGLGLKKKLSFKGVFHDQPWGLQTHIYLPLGVDLRNRYRIGGNQPDEPREVRELGIDTPLDGLYLRNDVEIICNATMASFVKKETKQAIGEMIDRMTKKAELLDEGKLHAMFENGRLMTSRPTMTTTLEDNSATVVASPPGSPAPFRLSPALQPPNLSGYGNYHMARATSQQRLSQTSPAQSSPQQDYQQFTYSSELPGMPVVNELPGSYYQIPGQQQQPATFTAELPGDNIYIPASADSKPTLHYQAYTPPPVSHPFSPPEQQRQPQPGSQAGVDSHQTSARHASASSSNYSDATSAPSVSAEIRASSNAASPEPDHSRFASLSIAGANNTLLSQQKPSSGTPPPQSLHSRSPPPPPLAMQGRNAKCPVCGIFEGDEAAVSHHVSKAHFS